MDRAAAETLIRKSYDARRRNDVDDTLACFHADASFCLAGTKGLSPAQTRLVGHDQIRAGFVEMFPAWDWSRFEIASLILDGDRAAVHCKGTLVFTPTGQEVETELVDLIRVADGRIVDFVEFVDTRALEQTVRAAQG